MNKYNNMSGYDTIYAMLDNGTFRTSGVEKDLRVMMDKFNGMDTYSLKMPVLNDGDKAEQEQSKLTNTEKAVFYFIMDTASILEKLREKYYFRVECMIISYMRAMLK
tara:strand:- start:2460 stop:2780 length:321 start_codon:yes stop_codon:yes gene_type:complete